MPLFRSLLIIALGASVGWAQELRTLGGKTVKGPVVSISDKEVVMREDKGEVKTPLSEVLAITFRAAGKPAPDQKYTLLRLLDDSILQCDTVAFKGNNLTVNLLSGQTATLPLNSVVYLIRDASNPKLKEKWDGLLQQKTKRDRVVILKDNELNPIEGTLGEVDPTGKNIQFRLDAGLTQAILLERLQGMLFHRTEVPGEIPTCMVVDVQGNTIAATKVAVDSGNFLVTTATGARITLAEASLAKLDYNMGKLTFLSDMEPKITERGGGLPLGFRFFRDLNQDKQPLQLGNTTYSKSISIRGNLDLEYNLGGKYKNLKAVIGYDPREGPDSKAVVTIECDGNRVFSDTVNAKDPRPLALNIRDVQTLRISVRSRTSVLNFQGDHATLAEARVSQ